jgi:hypothetical protein
MGNRPRLPPLLPEAVVKGVEEEYVDNMMHHVMAPPEMGPELSLQEYLKLLHSCVVHRLLPKAVTAMPAAQQVPAAELYSLLQLCFVGRPRLTPDLGETDSYDNDRPCPWLVKPLAQLPAMQQLNAEQVLWVLQHALQESAGTGVRQLLALPAAGSISADAAGELVLTAAQHGQIQRLKEICDQLPACAAAWEGLDPELLLQHLQAALSQQSLSDAGVICSLLQHATLRQHAGGVLPAVLLAGVKCYSKVKARPCFGLPMLPLALLSTQPGSWKAEKPAAPAIEDPELHVSLVQLAALLRLPAARQLSALVVCELMKLSVVHMGGSLLQEL